MISNHQRIDSPPAAPAAATAGVATGAAATTSTTMTTPQQRQRWWVYERKVSGSVKSSSVSSSNNNNNSSSRSSTTTVRTRTMIVLLFVLIFFFDGPNFLINRCCKETKNTDFKKAKEDEISRLRDEIDKLRQQQQQQQQHRMRTAVIFSGGVRTLTETGVMTSHVVNVIDALGADGRDDVDVFLHLNNATHDAVKSLNSLQVGTAPIRPLTDGVLNKIKDLLDPVQVIIHDDSSCTGVNGTLSNHECCSDRYVDEIPKWSKNFLQFGYLRHSYRTVKQYEAIHNITYDWYVRIRPDVSCFERLPAVRSLSTERYYLLTKEQPPPHGKNDYLFIVPRALSEQFFEEQIMTIFNDTCRQGLQKWPAEAWMFDGYHPNLPYQVMPFPCVHVHRSDQVECTRMAREGIAARTRLPTVYEVDGTQHSKGKRFVEACLALQNAGYFGDQNHLLDRQEEEEREESYNIARANESVF